MDVWESTLLKIMDTPGDEGRKPVVRVVATPGTIKYHLSRVRSLLIGPAVWIDGSGGIGKHIAGFIGAVNDAILHAIPPVSRPYLFPTSLWRSHPR
jgi:hypothetical protein